MYTGEQKGKALAMYDATQSIAEVIRRLGYPGPADKILDRKKGGIMYTREQKEYCRTGPFGLCLLWFLQSANV